MAIAYDNSAGAANNLNTVSYTNGGDLLFVHIGQNSGTSDPTTITYGGDSLTKLQTQSGTGSGNPARDSSLWYISNPKTGVNSFAVTGTDANVYLIISFSGTNGYTPTNYGQGKGQTGTDPNSTYTGTLTVSQNSWLAIFTTASDATHDMTAGTGTTVRTTGHDSSNYNWGCGDSNGTLAAGSQSLTLNWISASNYAGSIVEIKIAASSAVVRPTYLSLLGVS
jgi:hypothetical protein